jgi:hypothetical protein
MKIYLKQPLYFYHDQLRIFNEIILHNNLNVMILDLNLINYTQIVALMLFGSLVWQICVVGGQPKPYEGAPNDSSYLHTIEYPTTWWNFPPTFLLWRRLPSFLTISTSHGMGIHKNQCQCEVIWQRSNIGDPF